MGRKKEIEEHIDGMAEELKKIEKEESIHLVIEAENTALGSLGIEKKEESKSHTGEVGIFLHKKIRGKGIGKKALKTLIEEAEKRLGLEILTLSVYETNDAAKKLYRDVGFEAVGKIKDGAFHNQKYKDIIIMQKDLRN